MRSRVPHPRARMLSLIAGALLSIAAAVAIFYWGTCARVAEPYLKAQQFPKPGRDQSFTAAALR